MEKWVGRRIRSKYQTETRVQIALINHETERKQRLEDERRGYSTVITRPGLARENFEDFYGTTVSPDNATKNAPPKYISYWYRRYLCQKFSKYGDCEMNGCKHMHIPVDLSQRVKYPHYKMYLCPDYHDTGYCVVGYKCMHVHDEPLEQLGFRNARPIRGRGDMLLANIEKDRVRLSMMEICKIKIEESVPDDIISSHQNEYDLDYDDEDM